MTHCALLGKCFAFFLGITLFSAVWAQSPPDAGMVFVECDGCPSMTTMADGAAIGTYLVTRQEFAVFAEEAQVQGNESCIIREDNQWRNVKGKGWADPGFEQESDHPAVCINWLEATAYADWLSDRTGQYYRLPTYEESVAAAAADSTTAFWWGDDFAEVCARSNAADINFKKAFPNDPRRMVSCDDGYSYTSPVSAYPPNPLGLYDVVGNVWQWTNTCLKGDCSNAVFRGASWFVPNPKHFRSDGQWADRIVLRNSAVGFRVLRDPQ